MSLVQVLILKLSFDFLFKTQPMPCMLVVVFLGFYIVSLLNLLLMMVFCHTSRDCSLRNNCTKHIIDYVARFWKCQLFCNYARIIHRSNFILKTSMSKLLSDYGIFGTMEDPSPIWYLFSSFYYVRPPFIILRGCLAEPLIMTIDLLCKQNQY